MVAPAETFAAAACVGSSHALGGLEPTLARLRELVRPGGYLRARRGLLAARAWKRAARAARRRARRAARRFPELLEAGAGHGLELVYAATASDEDWRRYEWAYVFNLDRYIRDHPGEEGLDELVASGATASAAAGCSQPATGEALGFALVAWRKP